MANVPYIRGQHKGAPNLCIGGLDDLRNSSSWPIIESKSSLMLSCWTEYTSGSDKCDLNPSQLLPQVIRNLACLIKSDSSVLAIT